MVEYRDMLRTPAHRRGEVRRDRGCIPGVSIRNAAVINRCEWVRLWREDRPSASSPPTSTATTAPPMRPSHLASGAGSRGGAAEPLQRGADAARPRARGAPPGEVPERDRPERRLARGARRAHPRGDRRRSSESSTRASSAPRPSSTATTSRSSASPTSCCRPAAATRSATRSSRGGSATAPTPRSTCSSRPTAGFTSRRSASRRSRSRSTTGSARSPTSPTTAARRRSRSSARSCASGSARRSRTRRSAGRSARAAASSSAAGQRPSSGTRSGCLPWVDRGLVSELESRGVETYDQLLDRYDADSLAELERPWGKRRQAVGPQAERILTSARALATGEPIVLKAPAIPEHPNYVMFDLEGLPPQLDELEKIYLWGLQVFGERPGPLPRRHRRLRPARATARAGRRSCARPRRSSPSTATSRSSTGRATRRRRSTST